MIPSNLSLQEIQLLPAGTNILLQVPWDSADEWQSWLRKLGIGSTLHLDPAVREARLEPWTNLSAERLEVLLREGTLQPEPQKAA